MFGMDVMRRSARVAARQVPASFSRLPLCGRWRILGGAAHGGMRLAELTWLPEDGVESGAFLDQWTSPAFRRSTRLPIILTVRASARSVRA